MEREQYHGFPQKEILKEMRKNPVLLILLVLLCLCGCGRKDETGRQIVNWTLPDVEAFEENYTAEKTEKKAAEEKTAEQADYRWNPHGVFTYVTGSGGDYSMALFKILSVDYEKHCAVVTYTVKDSSGYERAKMSDAGAKEENYFFVSEGQKVVGLEENTEEDGTRHIILYLSNDHYLKFSGKDRMESAKYCYKNQVYRLKYEG